MQRSRFVLGIFLAFLTVFLIGCGGTASKPSTSATPPLTGTTPTTPTTPPTTPTTPPTTPGGTGGSGGTGSGGGGATAGTFVFTSGILSDNIWGYRFDPSSGSLTLLPGSPFMPSSNTTVHKLCDKWCGSSNRWLTPDPLGKFLFEATVNPEATFSYTVDPSTGALTQNDAIAGFSGIQPNIDPKGRFLVRVEQNADQTTNLNMIAIDRSNGKLSASGSATLPTGSASNASWQPAVDSDFVYAVIHSGNPTSPIYGYSVTPSLGLTATPGSPYQTGFFASRVVLHPSGKWAYVDNYFQSGTTYYYQWQQYTVNADGSLTATGTPIQTNTTGVGITQITPNGKILLFPDAAQRSPSAAGGMSVYLIDQTTGALTKGPFYPMRDELAVDPTSNWVFESVGTAINVYRLDSNTGTLTKVSSAPVPVDPNNDQAGSIAVVTTH